MTGGEKEYIRQSNSHEDQKKRVHAWEDGVNSLYHGLIQNPDPYYSYYLQSWVIQGWMALWRSSLHQETQRLALRHREVKWWRGMLRRLPSLTLHFRFLSLDGAVDSGTGLRIKKPEKPMEVAIGCLVKLIDRIRQNRWHRLPINAHGKAITCFFSLKFFSFLSFSA